MAIKKLFLEKAQIVDPASIVHCTSVSTKHAGRKTALLICKEEIGS